MTKQDRENQLTNTYVEPHKDIRQERPHVLVPNDSGNQVSIEHREKSLIHPAEESVKATRKEYGFRLLDPGTKEVAHDWQWLTTSEAREHVIRQSMSSGQFIIQRDEREV
jgi:hypothetical protein